MKRALLLLGICAAGSIAFAGPAPPPPPPPPLRIAPPPPPPPHAAPEIDWGVTGSTLVLLAGAVAILRGRRRA